MNSAQYLPNPASGFTRSHHSFTAQPYSDDEAACSVTLEPSLTNSSYSVNSSSSTSVTHRDRDSLHPQPLHKLPLISTHSSLLDIEREDEDESISDYDMSANHGLSFHSPATSMTQFNTPTASNPEDTVTESASFMEQTENNLVNISESLSGSFCIPNDINVCSEADCTKVGVTDCSGSNAKSQGVHYSDQIVNFRLMQDFDYLLGSSVMPCCEEKTIFNYCLRSETAVDEKDTTGNIRNRAGESFRARAYRIKRLRESRMAQDTTGVWNSSKHTTAIGPSHSMDRGMHQSSAMTRTSSIGHHPLFSTNKNKPKHEVNADPLGCIIGDCIEPISPVEGEENELEVVWKNNHDLLDDQDLCYDSDPGESSFRDLDDFKPRPRSAGRAKSDGYIAIKPTANEGKDGKKSKSRRRMQFTSVLEENGLDDSLISAESTESKVFAKTKDKFAVNGTHPVYPSNPTKSLDWENDVIFNVQNALNRTWTLTWHPTTADFSDKAALAKSASIKSPLNGIAMEQKGMSNIFARSPRCVHLWFERGNRIRRNDIVEPKLMWREAYHPELASQRKLNQSSTKGPNQVCLLSICRILPLNNNLDRTKYSFAKKSCAVLIRTCDDREFVFEAASEEERDQIAYMWKLVVARLASQAVVGDGESMVGEFFVPTSFGVP